MEQLDQDTKYHIDTSDQDAPVDTDEYSAEARDLETNDSENTITIPIRENSGKGLDCLDTNFGGNKYGTQFINIGEKKFMHDMHEIAVDAKFTQMIANKTMKRHVKRVILVYKDYTHIQDMKIMGSLEPYSITKSQKGGQREQ